MAIKSAISLQETNKKPSNKRMLVMLIVVAVLAVWSFLKNNTDDTDALELADSSVVSSQNDPSKTQPEIALHSDEQLQESKPIKNSLQNNAQNSAKSKSNNKYLIAWNKLQREPLFNQPHNAFKVHSWLVIPKPIKTKPLPPPPPMAPPAPFTYMGKLENAPQGTQLFLLRNGQLYTVLKGQKIDAQWRLDGDDLNSIQLTYLPLNLPQMLSKSAKTPDSAHFGSSNLSSSDFGSSNLDAANAESSAAAEMNL